MKTYKIEITITEGSDEFWEEIEAKGKTGTDEILEVVKESLEGWDPEVRLIEFTDK